MEDNKRIAYPTDFEESYAEWLATLEEVYPMPEDFEDLMEDTDTNIESDDTDYTTEFFGMLTD